MHFLFLPSILSHDKNKRCSKAKNSILSNDKYEKAVNVLCVSEAMGYGNFTELMSGGRCALCIINWRIFVEFLMGPSASTSVLRFVNSKPNRKHAL